MIIIETISSFTCAINTLFCFLYFFFSLLKNKILKSLMDYAEMTYLYRKVDYFTMKGNTENKIATT